LILALDGGIDLKKVMLAVLVLVAIIGISAGALYEPYKYSYPTRATDNLEFNTTFNFE